MIGAMPDRPQNRPSPNCTSVACADYSFYCADYRYSHSLELVIELVETADAVGQVKDKFR